MADERDAADEPVRMGQIVGAHGTQGWVKVRSDTQPPGAILDYAPWLIGRKSRPVVVRQGVVRDRSVLVSLDGIDDRTAAEALAGADITVPRSRLPDLPANRYYWADLVGCTVTTPGGRALGMVSEMIETGANDVMRVRGERERLIPFVMGQYVRTVDLDSKRIEVDWDPEF